MMDPIRDFFIRIKNAQSAGHGAVTIPYSKFKHEIAKVLERSGFVGTIDRKGKRVKKNIEIVLPSKEQARSLHDVHFFSLPSRRLYTSSSALKPARHGGVVILSTPKGVMTGEEAKKERVGGELIAEIW